jgi:hypothetical protein
MTGLRSAKPDCRLRAFALIGSYAAFVLAMWAPFGPFNGMSYEIGFALQSETSPLLNGFFFGDPLRVHTNFFYHLAYLFSKVIGLHGSWLAYQIIYALLWFARGILSYLIIRNLAPNSEMLAFLAGSLAIFHASDHTLNWVGQLNQFGFIFWMLLSFLMLIHALNASSERRALAWAALAAAFNYMSLWSYEAQLPVVLAAPWLFAVWRRKGWRRSGIVVGFYLLPAIIFIGMNVSRYVGATGGGYQVSVLRSDFAISSLVSDLGFNLKYVLAFWHWAELIPAQYAQQMYVGAPLFGAAAFLAGALLFLRTLQSRAVLPDTRSLLFLLFGAGLLLLASFPAYLMLNSARWLWRTQSLAGPFAAVVMAALISLVGIAAQCAVNRGRDGVQRLTILLFGAAIAFCGTLASERIASFHFAVWERARATMEGVLTAAPRLVPGSIVALLDVPRKSADGSNADPFGDNMWFDNAIKLSYPGANVTGYYFWSGAETPPGNRFFSEVRPEDFKRLVILRRLNAGNCETLAVAPPELRFQDQATRGYDPSSRVLPGPPAREARNRYLRFVAPWITPERH